jgi:hypothetical protein
MRYGALISWGVVMYAIMFLLWSGFLMYGFVEGVAPRLTGLVVLIVLALTAGRSLNILPYSLTWVVVVAILDIILTVPFTGWGLFSDWNIWVGYALIACVPLLSPLLKRAWPRPSKLESHES